MLRIAYFSPLPPQKSGIAAYSANLLPHLAGLASVTVFTHKLDPAAADPVLEHHFSIRDQQTFAGPLPERFDVCLYQMGNNVDYHEDIYGQLRRYPGVVTLHDVNLHSFHAELFTMRGRAVAYTREMAYAYGVEGTRHARQAHQRQIDYDVQRYPLFERVVNRSLGMIVHSRFAQRFVNGRCPNIPTVHINQPVPVPAQLPPSIAAKAGLGLNPDTFLLASFGYIAPTKRIEVVLRAFARLRRHFPQLHYALIGKPINGYTLSSLLAELDLENSVSLVGYADETTFQTYVAATDIGVNLRYPTLGETSATLLALMAAAKPVLVSNVDAFVELPEAACVKVDVGPTEKAQVETLLRALMTDDELRRQIGANAAAYIRQECDPAAVAYHYIDFIRALLGRTEIPDA